MGVVEGTVVGTDVVGESVAEAPAPRTLQLANIMAGRTTLAASDPLETAPPRGALAAKSAAHPITDDHSGAALDTCTKAGTGGIAALRKSIAIAAMRCVMRSGGIAESSWLAASVRVYGGSVVPCCHNVQRY